MKTFGAHCSEVLAFLTKLYSQKTQARVSSANWAGICASSLRLYALRSLWDYASTSKLT